MSQLKLSEQFRLDFSLLREACNGSPQTLLTFFRERPTFTKLAWEVDSAAGMIEKAGVYRKMLPQITPEFNADWKEFLTGWRKPVAYVVAADLLNGMEETFGQMPSFEDWVSSRSDPYAREAPEPNIDDEFVPEAHDGRAAVSAFLELAGDRAHDRRASGLDPDSITNTYLIGIEAVEYFEQVIGFSIGDAFDRWNALPPVFVPQHVSDQRVFHARSGKLVRAVNRERSG